SSVAGMDLFVDGRLVSTDRKAPYATEIDFGADIKRHTIVVTALTAGGRRAKVSFISRAADLAGDSVAPLAIVPAVVRDAGGRFVEGLSVGDFILTENGARQPILHLDNEPVPQSIAVAIQSSAPEEARGALLRGALTFTDALLTFDSLGLARHPGAGVRGAAVDRAPRARGGAGRRSAGRGARRREEVGRDDECRRPGCGGRIALAASPQGGRGDRRRIPGGRDGGRGG